MFKKLLCLLFLLGVVYPTAAQSDTTHTLSHDAPIEGALWNGDEVITWDENLQVSWWENDTQITTFTLPEFPFRVQASGDHLMVMLQNFRVQLYDKTGTAYFTSEEVNSVVFQAPYLLLGYDDRMVLHDSKTLEVLHEWHFGASIITPNPEFTQFLILNYKTDELSVLDITADAPRVLATNDEFVTARWNGSTITAQIYDGVLIYDAASGTPSQEITYQGQYSHVEMHPQSLLMLATVGDESDRLSVIDLAAGQESYEVMPLLGSGYMPLHYEWVETGESFLVVDFYAGNFGLWDAGQEVFRRTHGVGVQDAAISPDELFILSWSLDGSLVVWDAQNGTPLWAETNPAAVQQAIWHEDSTRFLTIAGNTVSLWDLSQSELAPITHLPESNRETLAAYGETLAVEMGCVGCHMEGGVAAPFTGLHGTQRTCDDGTTRLVDESYLSESILNPSACVVETFPAGVEPQNFATRLTYSELNALTAYIMAQSE